jgi:hypothetical protein
MTSVVLGFDARRPPAVAPWEPQRRARFLLREEVAQPLSTDTLVWPSLFDTGQGIGLPPVERERLQLAGLRPPPWTGANHSLWDDLGRMRRYLEENRAGPQAAHAVVAVTLLSDGRAPAAPGGYGPYPEPTVPAAISPAWRALGLDVADGSLVSGLMNCGYGADEVEGLRSRWAPHLNRHHLFDDAGEAFLFRDLSDTRVREHAPFFVYGLYVIEEVGGRVDHRERLR